MHDISTVFKNSENVFFTALQIVQHSFYKDYLITLKTQTAVLSSCLQRKS